MVVRRWQHIAAALLTLGTVASCGLPTDGEATAIASVPYDLLETNSPVTEPVVPVEDTGGHIVPVWVLAEDPTALFPIKRLTEEAEPSLQQAYDALVLGPNEAELAENPDLKSKVPDTLGGVLPDSPVNGVLTIVIDADVLFGELPEKQLITAQLVCTFLFFSSVDGVLLEKSDGTEVKLTSFDTETIEGAANASHFNGCQAPEPIEPEEA